jgi:hypothetical protein
MPVRDSPFSAIATTTVRGTLGDGTRIDQSTTARYYRDRAGRVRIEQMTTEGQLRVSVVPDPSDWRVYLLEPEKGKARVGPRFAADYSVGGGTTFALPLSGRRFLIFDALPDVTFWAPVSATGSEPLGRQVTEGVETLGRRLATASLTHERWESPELKLLIAARHSDPRMGVIEYKLTNLRREEPSPDLFAVPEGLTVVRDSECWIALVNAAHVRPELPVWSDSSAMGCDTPLSKVR